MRHDPDLFDLIPKPRLSMFKFFGVGFGLWFAFCLLMGLATMGALGYAVWWGLSIAERAVEQNETHQVEQP